MNNHFNFTRFNPNKYLITNDLGRYSFLSNDEFALLVNESFPKSSKKYSELEQKFFVFDSNQEVFLQSVREPMRFSKKYLFGSTSLFIFVVTNACNLDCVYCQAKDVNSTNSGFMTEETANKCLNIVFEAPTEYIDIEFQGGEPLLNFEIIKHIVVRASEMATDMDKIVRFSVVSNLTMITDEMTDFFKDHNVSISTSLDGNEKTHNSNRPYRNGKSTYKDVIDRIHHIQDKELSIGAIETTTRHSLENYKELVDTYVEHNLKTVFIRPLTPLGIAKVRWNSIGYTAEEYVSFYEKALRYILELNKNGIKISEGHAKLFLSKILYGDAVNYMELRSPCGATIGQIAFYYDGDIYTCDEGRMLAEMGNKSFKIGNIGCSYNDLVNCSVCKAASAASVLETIPKCCDCVYSPYCGTCPVINLALDNDITAKFPNNYRCKIYKGMLDVIFSILGEENESDIEIFKKWLKGE